MTAPLYSQLLKHRQLDYSPFHTPGHKSAEFFPENLLQLDFTELPDTDALYEADGVILETEKNLAGLFGTKGSFISSGGCTLAIQSMLKIACCFGKKILFARNIHRSAVNAAALLGIEPVWVMPKSRNGLFTGRVSPSDIEKVLDGDREISACYITSPDYYGEISDIKSISEICHKHNVLLAVDNAHGSHLAFLSGNLHPVYLGADMSACSLHKTMPVLTGGAVLNIGNETLLENAKDSMALFGSTSPSYPIMASIDLCCDYMLNGGGKEAYRQLEKRVKKIKELAERKGIIQPDGLCDSLRVCINTSGAGIAPESQTEYFHRHKIEPEFCDGENAVFICTPFNTERDFVRLENAVSGLTVRDKNIPETYGYTLPKYAVSPRQAVLAKSKIIGIEDSVGQIAADSMCPCPPGVPVVMPGEIIDKNVVRKLKSYGFKKIKVVL